MLLIIDLSFPMPNRLFWCAVASLPVHRVHIVVAYLSLLSLRTHVTRTTQQLMQWMHILSIGIPYLCCCCSFCWKKKSEIKRIKINFHCEQRLKRENNNDETKFPYKRFKSILYWNWKNIVEFVRHFERNPWQRNAPNGN